MSKLKILVPKDPLNPNDNCVQCGINGNFTTIMRGEVVIVSEEIFTLLEEGGYNPSMKGTIDDEEEAKAKKKAEAEAKKKAEAEAKTQQ